MLSYLISVSIHPLWCKLFVVDLEMGLFGISVAGFITNLTTLVFMVTLFHT